jgi:hypothetical protein
VASAGEPSRSEVLRSAICNETVRLCLEHSSHGLRALVLTGSLARNEATFEGGEGRWSFWGDAEFLLVCDSTGSLPPAARLAELRTRIEEALARFGIACRIGLRAVRLTYLGNLQPHLFAYELRACGRVLWGDPHILSLIPAFSPRDLSLEDAWRLLCNRMVEHLEVMEELADASAPQSGRVHYRTVKLYLDFAPLSFCWCAVQSDGSVWMNGGLIFHGPDDGWGSGRAPTYSVSVDTANGWRLHT